MQFANQTIGGGIAIVKAAMKFAARSNRSYRPARSRPEDETMLLCTLVLV